jgi:alpha-glucan phosphorylases
VVFLEDYDIAVARYLVQGVDVWLNTPRRPMEASGTSGMKVLPNGGLNLSILDGWWCEGYDQMTGWAIGSGEEYEDAAQQDEVESQALYDLLEREVVPLYYDLSPEGTPLGWIAKMRNSMKKLCPIFNTNRMVAEYTERFYLRAARRYQALTADSAARAKNLVQWRTRVYSKWNEVSIEKVETDRTGPVAVGANLEVNVLLRLGTLPATDVSVQAYYGIMNAGGRPELGTPQNLELYQSPGEGLHQYRGSIAFPHSGQWGFSIRVVPFHPDAILPYEFPLITWEPD